MEPTISLFNLKLILSNLIVFFFGAEIGVDKVTAWFMLVVFNTIIWIGCREKYGTTVERIVKKQTVEIFMTIGMVFAAKAILGPANMGGLSWFIFLALMIRQAGFIFLRSMKVMSTNDLDDDGIITNMVFKKIIDTIGKSFNLEATDIEKLQEIKPKPKKHTNASKSDTLESTNADDKQQEVDSNQPDTNADEDNNDSA